LAGHYPLASGWENKPGFPIFRFLLFFLKADSAAVGHIAARSS
jgi:hypothetical protein